MNQQRFEKILELTSQLKTLIEVSDHCDVDVLITSVQAELTLLIEQEATPERITVKKHISVHGSYNSNHNLALFFQSGIMIYSIECETIQEVCEKTVQFEKANNFKLWSMGCTNKYDEAEFTKLGLITSLSNPLKNQEGMNKHEWKAALIKEGLELRAYNEDTRVITYASIENRSLMVFMYELIGYMKEPEEYKFLFNLIGRHKTGKKDFNIEDLYKVKAELTEKTVDLLYGTVPEQYKEYLAAQ